jgi:hypothetical protein
MGGGWNCPRIMSRLREIEVVRMGRGWNCPRIMSRLREIGCEDGRWVELHQDHVQ